MRDIILETNRLLLRCPEKGDIDFFVELWTDEEITKYVGGPRDKNDLLDSFNDALNDPKEELYSLWFVVLKGTNELIGMAGILPKTIGNEEFYEINYFINKKYWGNGYATEISKEIIAYMKDKKGIRKFIAIIDKNNISSENVAQKTGMTFWKTIARNEKLKDIYKGEY
jgi:ribosomal-protein-alanine N-acetyltransferase